MRVLGQPAWILHRRPWRESSLLIELFSREHGRIGVVARGARGARSPWRGLCEPFLPLAVDWSRRGELATLSGLEPRSARVGLVARALWCGLYANELMLNLIGRDDPVPELFEVYARTIELLPDAGAQAGTLRGFELALLETLGVLPDLGQTAGDAEVIHADGLYHIVPDQGLIPVSAVGAGVVSGRTALALAARELDPSDRELHREARVLTRLLIDHQLGGRALKTRDLLRDTAMRRTTE